MIDDSTERDKNIVDLLTELQAELEKTREEKRSIEAQLNSFRLGYFKIPLECDPIDETPMLMQAKGSIVDLLSKPDGILLVEKFMKRQLNFMSECSSFVEDYKSRKAIKVKLDKVHTDGIANAQAEREKPRPHKGPLKLTPAEKAVRELRKMYPSVTQTQLLPFVQALVPGLKDEKAAREVLESYFAKEVQRDSKKEKE